MKRVAILLVSFLLCIFSDAQVKDSVIYYNSIESRVVEPEQASIIALIKLDDKGMYHRKSYYIFSKTLSTQGDSYDLYNHQKEGEQIHYYANGSIESIGHYTNGRKNGVFVSFYPDGTMKDSCNYKMNWPVGAYNTWHMNGNPEIVSQFDSTKMGTGVFVSFFSNGNVACKGRYDFGLRKVGQWNYYHVNGKSAAIVQYPKTNESRYGYQVFLQEDPLEHFAYDSSQHYTSIRYFDIDGVMLDSVGQVNRMPQFGKNDQVWDNYIRGALHQKVRNYDIAGVMSYDIYFTIDEEGKTTDIQIGNKLEPELDYFVKNMIKSSGKWQPALQNGRAIPYKMESHIAFSVTKIN